jgi:hypothetical protein
MALSVDWKEQTAKKSGPLSSGSDHQCGCKFGVQARWLMPARLSVTEWNDVRRRQPVSNDFSGN